MIMPSKNNTNLPYTPLLSSQQQPYSLPQDQNSSASLSPVDDSAVSQTLRQLQTQAAVEADQNRAPIVKMIAAEGPQKSPTSLLTDEQETLFDNWVRQTPTQEQFRCQLAKERILEFASDPKSEIVDLSNLGIISIPYELLSTLTNMKDLDISNNHLTALPSEFNQLTALQIIEISNNDLQCFPEILKQMNSLEQIHIRHNRLSTLPDWLSQSSLIVVASYNQLPEASHPSMVEFINATCSRRQQACLELTIEEIKEQFIQHFFHPQRQESSALVATPLINPPYVETTPEGGVQLEESLETWVSKDSISRSLAKDLILKAYENQSPHLSFRQINPQLRLPIEVLLKLPHLSSLDLNHRELFELPEALQRLTQLKKLFLTGNHLRVLPAWLADMPNLEEITVEDNCLRAGDQGIPARVNEKFFSGLLPKNWVQLRQLPGLDDLSLLKEEGRFQLKKEISATLFSEHPEEIAALTAYVHDRKYKEMNRQQRSEKSNQPVVEFSLEKREELARLNRHCNSAVKRIIEQGGTLEPSTRLFRTVILPNNEVERLVPEKIYQPNQLLSVSTNLSLPLTAGINAKAPEGSQNVLLVFEESAHLVAELRQALKSYGSSEFLFPIESQFRVLNSQQNGDFYQVHLMCLNNS